MKAYISPEMADFLTPKQGEEAVDQPLYHIQSYATGGATSYTFFGVASSAATNGLADTNMDAAGVLSAGKRFAIFSVSVGFLAGALPTQVNQTTAASYLNDAAKVLEGISYSQLQIMDKIYLTEATLTRTPSGQGLGVGAGGVQLNQTSAADKQNLVSYASNGAPQIVNKRFLRVPLPVPQQVKFSYTIYFPTAISIGTASRLGVWFDGTLVRATQ